MNAAGNYLHTFGALPHARLELVGLGASTSFAHWFMFAALLGFCLVDRQFRRYHTHTHTYWWRADWPRFARSFASVCRSARLSGVERHVRRRRPLIRDHRRRRDAHAMPISLQVSAILFMIPFGMAQASTGASAAAGRQISRGRGSATHTYTTVGTALATAVLQKREISNYSAGRGDQDGAAAITTAASFCFRRLSIGPLLAGKRRRRPARLQGHHPNGQSDRLLGLAPARWPRWVFSRRR